MGLLRLLVAKKFLKLFYRMGIKISVRMSAVGTVSGSVT